MILDRYLVRQFFPIFFVALALFVFLLQLIDLFANLVRYLNNEIPLETILRISWYYLPKCVSYALPIALLFAGAYTLGDLYSKNELTTVFASGIPLWRFSLPLILIGAFTSVFLFFFEDILVIPTYQIKNDLTREALRQFRTEHNSDIVIRARGGEIIYSIDFFDQRSLMLNGVTIIEKNPLGGMTSLVRASSASWNGSYWNLHNAVIYQYENDMIRIRPFLGNSDFREHPDIFTRSAVIVEELRARDVKLLVEDLRNAGLPFTGALANYYHRFSFSVAPLIVMILSISTGGRFRKNVILMSLFTSLASAAVFYIMEMLSMTMAGLGYIPPIVGAWFPVVSFIIIGLFMLRGAKT